MNSGRLKVFLRRNSYFLFQLSNILTPSANIHTDFRFCGWVDVDLSARGHKEAETAAKAIAESGHLITKIYTSMLRRAHQTVENVLKVDMILYLSDLYFMIM